MKLFLDCEFTQLNKDTKLISLALVTQTGEEFYVELSDTYTIHELDVMKDLAIRVVGGQLLIGQSTGAIAFDKCSRNFRPSSIICSVSISVTSP